MELTIEVIKKTAGYVNSDVIKFLLDELDHVEKQTAEKCVEIAGDTAPEYIAAYIMHHFDLKEMP